MRYLEKNIGGSGEIYIISSDQKLTDNLLSRLKKNGIKNKYCQCFEILDKKTKIGDNNEKKSCPVFKTSHQALMYRLSDSVSDFFMIFEDTVELSEIQRSLKKIQDIPDDWGIIQLAGNHQEIYNKATFFDNTEAYIIRKISCSSTDVKIYNLNNCIQINLQKLSKLSDKDNLLRYLAYYRHEKYNETDYYVNIEKAVKSMSIFSNLENLSPDESVILSEDLSMETDIDFLRLPDLDKTVIHCIWKYISHDIEDESSSLTKDESSSLTKDESYGLITSIQIFEKIKELL